MEILVENLKKNKNKKIKKLIIVRIKKISIL